jgi:hypothetical protein
MTFKLLLPFMAASLLLNGFLRVEAVEPKQLVSQETPSVSQQESSPWKVFTAPDGRFTVLMPGIPEIMTQTQKTFMGEINLQVIVAQPPNQEVAYVVAYNDFPNSYAQLKNPQVILNNARDMALKLTQSNLVRQRNIRSSNGHPGKEIEYVDSGGKITKNRMYLAEGRLYQVMVITTTRQQKTLSGTMRGFLNSFHVVFQTE